MGYSDSTTIWLGVLLHSDRFYQVKITTCDCYLLRRTEIVDCTLGLVKGGYGTGRKAENLLFKFTVNLFAYINVLR